MAAIPPESRASGSVERSFSILQAVVAARRPVGVRELARITGLPRSTVARLVKTLDELGMVERTGDRSVAPGTGLATLEPHRTPIGLWRDRLRPLVNALADLHDESVALAVDDGNAVLYLVQTDASSPVRAPDVREDRHPFHVVAHGLVLMATWSQPRLDRYLAEPLAATTTSSLVDASVIRGRLQQIGRDGFVWTVGEFADEVNGLAVAVEHQDGAVASVGYYGPAYRFSPDLCPDLGNEVRTRVDGALAGRI